MKISEGCLRKLIKLAQRVEYFGVGVIWAQYRPRKPEIIEMVDLAREIVSELPEEVKEKDFLN